MPLKERLWRLMFFNSQVDADTTVRRRGRDHHEVELDGRRFRVFTEMMAAGPVDFVIDRDSVQVVDPVTGEPANNPAVIEALCRYFDTNRYRYDFY